MKRISNILNHNNLSFLLPILCMISCEQPRKQIYSIGFPENSKIDTVALRYANDMSNVYIDTYVSSTGLKYPFVFDTGADRTVLNERISGNKTGKQYKGWDINGDRFSLGGVEMDTLKIGDIGFYHGDFYRSFPFENFNGIIGGDLLRNFVWKIEFAAQKAYIANEIEAFDVKKNEGLSFTFNGNVPRIECSVNGKLLNFQIDFGYSGAVSINKNFGDSLNTSFKEVIEWQGYPLKFGPFNKKRDTLLYSYNQCIGTIVLGDNELKNELITVDPYKNNLLGLDFFARFEYVILDYPNRKLYLGKPQYKSIHFIEQIFLDMNSMGIKILSEKTPTISAVSSDIQGKGIFNDDTIIALNGVPIYKRDLSFYEPEMEYEKITIYNNGIRKDTSLPIFRASKLDRLLRDFYGKRDMSKITIKRGDSLFDVQLVRNYHHTSMPDTVQNYIWSSLVFKKNNYKKSYTLRDTSGIVIRERYIYIPNYDSQLGKPNIIYNK